MNRLKIIVTALAVIAGDFGIGLALPLFSTVSYVLYIAWCLASGYSMGYSCAMAWLYDRETRRGY
jgi:uncharacterized membrane protein YbaN (DUF454 family)